MNVAQPQPLNNQPQNAKGYGGNGQKRAKTSECDPKKFFSSKFSRSVCGDGVVPSEIGSEALVRLAESLLLAE